MVESVVHQLCGLRLEKKSYADKRRKPLGFSVGDYVLLKLSPWKGVVHFGKQGKLTPRSVGPFKIIEKVGHVAYRLDLPKELDGVHDTFHVSNLKKCLADLTLQVPLDEIRVDSKLNFMEEPVEILEREFKKLKRSRIAIVKVWWNSKCGPEFTSEHDIMESVISCVSAKKTSTNLVYSFEGPSDTKENRIMDLKLEYQTFKAKSTESLSHTYTRYKTLLNELANDGVNLSKHEINVGFVNSLPEKWVTFSQGLRNANHTQTLDLADIYKRFIYEENLIQRRYSDTKKALLLPQALQFLLPSFLTMSSKISKKILMMK
ncbi:hypothetical protein Tco_1556816 [Tanacetum coccineum]